MSSSESDSKVVTEDEDEDEEEQIYRLIYNMSTTGDKEEKEKVQTPPSSGAIPVHLKIDAEKTHAVVDNTERPDMASIQDIPVMANTEETPWEKAGANISDYFNYGFDEESWNTYCKKQSKLRAANRKLCTKIMIQKGHPRHKEKVSAYPSSSTFAFRQQSNATRDVFGGQPGPSSRVEGHRCLSDEGNNTQVVTEMFPEERSTFYNLPSPSNYNSLFAFTPPQPLPHRREPPPLPSLDTLDSGHSKGSDDPSTSLCPSSSGVSPSIPKTMTSRTGWIETAKAWECYIWQDRCYMNTTRARKHGHNKHSKRNRNKKNPPSSYNSTKEQRRHKDTTEQRHKRRSFDRFGGGKEEQHQERRHRDKNEGWQKSSCSSSSRRSQRDSDEDRDSQSRHKPKKAKKYTTQAEA
uniref:Pre-mRNA polyadenylation factor Fip1 domain-containing protein n=1 Tax=Dicentrarchus labrax TaxID=13489 RepID=A0A8P4G1V8_DICLA